MTHPTSRWSDRDAPWFAKLRRAALHVAAATAALDGHKASDAWRVESQSGPAANETTQVLRVSRVLPSDVLTIIGDAVHNMRTALDSVVFELARGHVGRMTGRQEQASEFPSCATPEKFAAWLRERGRETLFGDHERRAIECVQPYAFDEEARALGIDVQADPHRTRHADAIFRLHSISVIDKHRRLPTAVLIPELAYWGGDGADTYDWRPVSASTYSDGSVLGRFVNVSSETPPVVTPHVGMRLVFGDDPMFALQPGSAPEIGDALQGWLQTIRGWVPRMMVVAEGEDPPLFIPANWAPFGVW